MKIDKTHVANIPVEEVFSLLKTDSNGLKKEEVERRRKKFGLNILSEERKKPAILYFLKQFNDPIVWILLAALILSGFVLKEYIDALAIGTILIANAIFGFIQEYRADKALDKLKALTTPECRVKRAGKILNIKTKYIVKGDIILLEAGDKIPADARIINSYQLACDESPLTGETIPVYKHSDALMSIPETISEYKNIVFSGLTVVKGKGEAVVFSTGSDTEIGEIAQLVNKQSKDETPLQRNLRSLSKQILIVCLSISTLLFILGLLKGMQPIEMFLSAISLAVASIPESLPAVITIALAIGINKMAEERAIVKRLHAVETLGAINVICTDKTGTLTENHMRVERTIISDEFNPEKFLLALLLCNDVYKEDDKWKGDPTEIALVEWAELQSVQKEKLELLLPKKWEIPFEPERKMMSTVHKDQNGYIMFTKGAPEIILTLSSHIKKNDKKVQFHKKDKEEWLKEAETLARNGFRCLAVAMKTGKVLKMEEKNLTFLGLVAESDPVRKEVPEAVRETRQAGIDVKIITGDYATTAKAIAESIGITGNILSAQEIEKAIKKNKRIIYETSIFSRVSPLQKMDILNTLKEQGKVVAMTGDGVNDAPAIKRADIGISMGITGTEVAKEASDMVITDDNFATIVKAIKHGRIIFTNIKKFIYFLISCNLSEVFSMFFIFLLGFPIPMLPIQILWVNLITDGLPALAIGMDPGPTDTMKKPPRDVTQGILSRKSLFILLIEGIFLTAGVMFAYIITYTKTKDIKLSRTVAFSVLVLSQLLHSFNFRVGKKFFFSKALFRNKFLIIAFFLSLILHVIIVFFPPAQTIFHTSPVDINHSIIILLSAFTPVILINIFFKGIKG